MELKFYNKATISVGEGFQSYLYGIEIAIAPVVGAGLVVSIVPLWN